LKVEHNNTVWTSGYQKGQVITIPIAHGEGRYYADRDTIKALEDEERVLFRYCSQSGEINQESNPNGSIDNIAGIINSQGNVLGMMPHPERASDSTLGFTDGLPLFKSLIGQMAVN
jgi:phosphoribosylformylglycinamidine synthase